jgi:ABC-type sugar transport system ATPase subunit
LARALVGNPAIVLMDEPLSNLDRELSQHLRQEILRLHAELSFTLVYVTHSPEEAAELGSRVLAMRQGRVEPLRVPTS